MAMVLEAFAEGGALGATGRVLHARDNELRVDTVAAASCGTTPPVTSTPPRARSGGERTS